MAIIEEKRNKVLWITLDRPECLNALDIPHLQSLLAILESEHKNTDTRCIVITGRGRAFCVGADIKAMDVMTDDEFEIAASLYQDLCRKCLSLDIPIIAAINGYALGGGLEIALMSDIRIAGKSAKLGLPDAELGFSPTGGLTWLISRIIGHGRAMHLALSAKILDAQESEKIGLVTEVIEDNNLEERVSSLANQIAQYPQTGIRNIKRSLVNALDSDLENSLVLEAQFDNECYQSNETREALTAFLSSKKNK